VTYIFGNISYRTYTWLSEFDPKPCPETCSVEELLKELLKF
jgi:hypothetical protein